MQSDGKVLQLIFTCALALSAVLLFWVQPMFAKMVLPLLGGAPAVWNTILANIGTVVNLHEINTLTVGAFGGLAGFLAGWIWTSRSDESKE